MLAGLHTDILIRTHVRMHARACTQSRAHAHAHERTHIRNVVYQNKYCIFQTMRFILRTLEPIKTTYCKNACVNSAYMYSGVASCGDPNGPDDPMGPMSQRLTKATTNNYNYYYHKFTISSICFNLPLI